MLRHQSKGEAGTSHKRKKNWKRLHAGQADDDLYELAQYIKTMATQKLLKSI